MSAAFTERILGALSGVFNSRRLYEFDLGPHDNPVVDNDFLVEAFCASDGLQEAGSRSIILLSTNPFLDLNQLLGQPATLTVGLANGRRTEFAGDIVSASMLGSNGSMTRYRIELSHWIRRLEHVRNSRVWENKSVVDIVDAVFTAYQPVARWRWSDETKTFMDRAVQRSYCCQYRESDLDFVSRVLAEEGLSWRFEQDDNGPIAVLFADSSQGCAVPEDVTSKASGGLRFVSVPAGEHPDAVHALQTRHSIGTTLSTVLSYDYTAKKTISGSAPSLLGNGRSVPILESFDTPGQRTFASIADARRSADLHMQGTEARRQVWHGRSTVRTLRAGTKMAICDRPFQESGSAAGYTVVKVISIGVNNLPATAVQALAELFGPIPELLQELARDEEPAEFNLVVEEACGTGYANHFDAVKADVPWRPLLPCANGCGHLRPTAHGAQTAIVVGADGNDQPSGADELYCDRFGRVRIRFHWQSESDASCWVRVAQRSAGGGMGSQFLPRIGQEVLVQFLENDIDRPIIVGALYNGQGEGGTAPTPGGASKAEAIEGRFDMAHDHSPSAQGNLAGANSPLWHGASGDSGGHRNGAALWGIRSKEFGASGYNQLMFDDTDSQGRIQLKSSHAASELNLGHLIHCADNYRGSFRGTGAELRTDAYGAVRAGAGLLITSYKISHNAARRDPAGDNVAGIAMLKQAMTTAEQFSKVAETHRTVALSSHLGVKNDEVAPLKSMLTAVAGMVSDASIEIAHADARGKNTAPGDGKLPHTSDAVIAITAQAGLGVIAGNSVQMANGETVTLMSGQDMQFVTGGQMRVHAGQAIGVLAGAMQAGEGGTGMQLITAEGDVDLQAQADKFQVQARDEVSITSANAHVDWAAAQSISLSTAGGANITISGGNITIQCPGKLLIHAGVKHFGGPERAHFSMPELPRSVCVECMKKSLAAAPAFTQAG